MDALHVFTERYIIKYDICIAFRRIRFKQYLENHNQQKKVLNMY